MGDKKIQALHHNNCLLVLEWISDEDALFEITDSEGTLASGKYLVTRYPDGSWESKLAATDVPKSRSRLQIAIASLHAFGAELKKQGFNRRPDITLN